LADSRHAAAGQRQRDAPGPDAELQRLATPGQFRQQADRLVHRARLEHAGRPVVRRRDPLAEVVVRFFHRGDRTPEPRPDAPGFRAADQSLVSSQPTEGVGTA
jgi:hypothetical protein